MADDVLKTPLTAMAPPLPRSDELPAGRQAGIGHLILLLAASCLSVLGAVLIAPVLPQMNRAFASTANHTLLVPLVLTIPALFIGLASPFAGVIVDRIDRKRALVVAMVLYTVFGTMPLYLQGLGSILVSRVLVGLCEAAIMTAATTLIADYWDGARRARYLGMQTLTAALSAVVFTAVGGVLGASGWRTPFWLYLVAAPLAIPIAIMIFQPRPARRLGERTAKLPSIPWDRLRLPLAVTLIGGIVFYTLIVYISIVLDANGMKSTAQIGIVTAAMSLMTALGSVAFGFLVRRGPRILLPVGFVLAALGLAAIAASHSPAPIIVGALFTGFGTGLLLPTLLTWTVGQVTFEQRGRGTGLFTGTLFIGEFFCPVIVAAMAKGLGADQGAIGVLAVVAVVMAVLTAVLLRRPGSGAAIDSEPVAA